MSQAKKIPKLSATQSRVPVITPSKKAKLVIGAKVCISGQREGLLRFHGNTEFADGVWCGVELFEDYGKHDGTVEGVRYFTCPEKRGVFAADHKVTPLNSDDSLSADDSHNSQSSSTDTYHKSPTRHSTIPCLTSPSTRSPRDYTRFLPRLNQCDSKVISSTPEALSSLAMCQDCGGRECDCMDSSAIAGSSNAPRLQLIQRKDNETQHNETFDVANPGPSVDSPAHHNETFDIGNPCDEKMPRVDKSSSLNLPPLNLTFDCTEKDTSVAADGTYELASTHSEDIHINPTAEELQLEDPRDGAGPDADQSGDVILENSSSLLELGDADGSFGVVDFSHPPNDVKPQYPPAVNTTYSSSPSQDESSLLGLSSVDISFGVVDTAHPPEVVNAQVPTAIHSTFNNIDSQHDSSLLWLSSVDVSFGVVDTAHTPEIVNAQVPTAINSTHSNSQTYTPCRDKMEKNRFYGQQGQQGAYANANTPETANRASLVASTPCMEGDEEFMSFDMLQREAAKVLAAIEEVKEAAANDLEYSPSDSILHLSNLTGLSEEMKAPLFEVPSPQNGTFDIDSAQLNSTEAMCGHLNSTRNIESPQNATPTIEASNSQLLACSLNGTHTLKSALNDTCTIDSIDSIDSPLIDTHTVNNTQTLDCGLNNTQTLDCGLNNTQTLDCGLNNTQTLDCGLNNTHTLDCGANSTQTLVSAPNNTLSINHGSSSNAVNITQTLDDMQEARLNTTETIESHANTTQTIHTDPLQNSSVIDCEDSNDARVEDDMKMSVDDSTLSKGGLSSMAVSSDSLVIGEEIPVDRHHSTHAAIQTVASSQSDRATSDLSSNQMQVDEVDTSTNKSAREKVKTGKGALPVKSSVADRRKTLPAVIANKPTSRLAKPRESLLPSAISKPKEKEKSTEKVESPTKVIQKSRPKSKWADISKQIEKNAKAPKSTSKPAQSKLSAADSETLPSLPAATLRKPVERANSVSSDVSQASQTSGARAIESTAKKPLKRHTLLPPSSTAQKPDFKKHRASLLPPPSTTAKALGFKARGKVAAEPKQKSQKIASIPESDNSLDVSEQHSDGPPPDVVSSNTLTPSPKAKPSTSSAAADKSPPKDKSSGKVASKLQADLKEALRVSQEKENYICGLKDELKAACRGVEGLGVVTQHLSQMLEGTRQQLASSREHSTLLTHSHEQELFSFQTDTELLTANHEEEKRAVITQLTEDRDKERLLHAEESDRLRQELSQLRVEYSSNRNNLMKENEALSTECKDLRSKCEQATEALHKNIDHRLQVALQPYQQLPQEIESLRAVLELKSAEVKELRSENNVYKQKVELIPDIEKKLYDTEQKLENLQAVLDIVSSKEKETAEKYHKITRKAVQEKKENHRLSLNLEALELKLEEAEFTHSMHIDQSGELDISTASLPPYGLDNPDTSPSQFTRSFSRSSIKRRSQRGSNNNNATLDIPEDERQISPAKHLVLRSPSSSPSPTRLTSPRRPHSAISPINSAYNRSSTLPRSYRTNNHQRCNSDSARPL